jgi:hypothetical protein
MGPTKSFATTTKGIRPVCTCIWTVWPLFEKISKECSSLMPWFSSNLTDLSPIYSLSSLGFEELHFGHHFHPSSILLHFTFANPSRQPLSEGSLRYRRPGAPRGDEDRAEDWHRATSRVWIIFFVAFSVISDNFCRMSLILALCIFTIFLYAAMSG